MKQVVKIILAAAAVVAFSVPAMAASGDVKLKVRDDGNAADVFTVDNTGKVNAAKVGLGVAIPEVTLHAAETTTSATRGLMSAQHNDGAQAPYVLFRKSRGSNPNLQVNVLNAAAMVATGDYTASLDAQGWDGYNYLNGAGAAFIVDGTVVQGAVSANVAAGTYPGRVPTAYVVLTGNKTGNLANFGRAERFRVSSDGRLRLSNQPAAPANNATCTQGDMIGDYANGYLYGCKYTTTSCTGAGAPHACCTGAGAGTCWGRASFAAY